jgi:hypothetical protein
VEVTCDPEDASWLTRRSAPFFEVQEATRGGAWTICAGRGRTPRSADYVAQEWTHPSGEFSRTLISAATRSLMVDISEGPWRPLYLLRAVRSLLRWQLQAQHALYLHGVAMARRADGAGVCILGRSRAGKSVLSYRLLVSGEWDFVTQDDICLLPSGGEGWTILGWPGALRLRRQALSLFPDLVESEGQLQHPANDLERKLPEHQAMLRIFPEELASLHGCGIRGEAPLRALIVLDAECPDREPVPLTASEIQEQLQLGADILPERRAGVSAEEARRGDRPWRDLLFNPQLLDAFGLPDLSALGVRRHALATGAPAWRAGREALARPGALDRLLDEAGRRNPAHV